MSRKRSRQPKARLRPVLREIAAGAAVGSARVTIQGQIGTSLLLEEGKLGPRRRHVDAARLPRQTCVDMAFPRPMYVRSYKLGLNGEVLIFDQFGVPIHPQRSVVSLTHSRPSGKEKVMVRYFQDAEIPLVDMTRFLERFTALYAVDTNSVPTEKGTLHVTGIVRARLMGRVGEDLASHIQGVGCFDRLGQLDDPEAHGWAGALSYIAQEEKVSDETQIGFIVDSHLAKLDRIHRGEIPYFEDNLLPLHTALIYASDSSGAEEYLPCQMIRLADNMARQRAGEILRAR